MISEVAQINSRLKKIQKMINKRKSKAKDFERKKEVARKYGLKMSSSNFKVITREHEFTQRLSDVHSEIKELENQKKSLQK